MATEEFPSESRVEDDYAVRIPTRIRDQFDVSPGDRVQWSVTDDGDLTVEVVEQEYGAFEGAEVVSLGGAADDHDCMGLED